MTETVSITEEPQSKFQFFTEPLQTLPHKCAGCSRYSSNDPDNPLRFVSWNLDVEFYGVIYICVDCLRQMAERMGYMEPKNVKSLIAKKSQLIQDVSNLLNENMELRNALGIVERVRSDSSVDSVSSVPDEESDEESDVKVGDGDDITLGDSEGENRSLEQTTESGSTDVSDNEDDLSDFLGDI